MISPSEIEVHDLICLPDGWAFVQAAHMFEDRVELHFTRGEFALGNSYTPGRAGTDITTHSLPHSGLVMVARKGTTDQLAGMVVDALEVQAKFVDAVNANFGMIAKLLVVVIEGMGDRLAPEDREKLKEIIAEFDQQLEQLDLLKP